MGLDTMNTEGHAMDYLRICMDDSRLNVWHLAILIAIVSLGHKQGHMSRIKVSRSNIIELSHVNMLPMYTNISSGFRILAT